MVVSMTALPVDDCDPDDPVEILRVLPARFHEQFLAEYDAAVADARRPEQYRQLHQLLRLWRLSAIAFSDPGYEARHQAVEDAVRAGRRGTPIEQVVPDWDERLAAARRRRASGRATGPSSKVSGPGRVPRPRIRATRTAGSGTCSPPATWARTSSTGTSSRARPAPGSWSSAGTCASCTRLLSTRVVAGADLRVVIQTMDAILPGQPAGWPGRAGRMCRRTGRQSYGTDSTWPTQTMQSRNDLGASTLAVADVAPGRTRELILTVTVSHRLPREYLCTACGAFPENPTCGRILPSNPPLLPFTCPSATM